MFSLAILSNYYHQCQSYDNREMPNSHESLILTIHLTL